jgi:hypothetical protein
LEAGREGEEAKEGQVTSRKGLIKVKKVWEVEW